MVESVLLEIQALPFEVASLVCAYALAPRDPSYDLRWSGDEWTVRWLLAEFRPSLGNVCSVLLKATKQEIAVVLVRYLHKIGEHMSKALGLKMLQRLATEEEHAFASWVIEESGITSADVTERPQCVLCHLCVVRPSAAKWLVNELGVTASEIHNCGSCPLSQAFHRWGNYDTARWLYAEFGTQYCTEECGGRDVASRLNQIDWDAAVAGAHAENTI